MLLIAYPAAGAPKREKTDCGKIKSTSIYDRARVFAIRGVDCDVAVKVAKKFDHKSVEIPPWVCGLSHGSGRTLFSCGYGDDSGDIRDFPHALVVKAVGK